MVNDYSFSDLENLIEQSLQADAVAGGEAVETPAFRAAVYYGQLAKLARVEAIDSKISQSEMADHLNDLTIQALILTHSYARMLGLHLSDLANPTDSINQYAAKLCLTDQLSLHKYALAIFSNSPTSILALEAASGSLCNAITHKKHEGGDQACYELPQEELVTRGKAFLNVFFSYLNAKIKEYELKTTVSRHFEIGYEEIRTGKGKDSNTQASRGRIEINNTQHTYQGKPVMIKSDYFVGVAQQLGNTLKLPSNISQPTVLVAERFSIDSIIPEGKVALIMEHGGKNSHLAIISREKGLHGVYGVGNSDLIKTGDILCLDLTGGVAKIYLLAMQSKTGHKLTSIAKNFYDEGRIDIISKLEQLTNIIQTANHYASTH